MLQKIEILQGKIIHDTDKQSGNSYKSKYHIFLTIEKNKKMGT